MQWCLPSRVWEIVTEKYARMWEICHFPALSFRKGCWHWHWQQHTLLNCITFSIVASECVILAMHTAADSREESAHTYTLRAKKISQLSRNRELIYRLSLSHSFAPRSLVARLESDRTQFAEKRWTTSYFLGQLFALAKENYHQRRPIFVINVAPKNVIS